MDVEVLAIDLDVRDRSTHEAFTAMASAAELSVAGASPTVFVKIDSTLRGPIAALVDGALRGSQAEIGVIAPAFPEQGRLFRRGRLFVNGHAGQSLVEILNSHPNLVVTADDLERQMSQAQRNGIRHVIVDADSVDSLRSVASVALQHPEWLLVGSAGLARQLASPATPVALPNAVGILLVVAGSPAAATHEQLRHVETLQDVVILSTTPATDRDIGQSAAALATRVAAWAATHQRPRAVVLAGGATARLVCHRLGVQALRVHGELAPGIPIATFEGGAWHGVTVVTKAGSFGTPETLLDVARALGVSSTERRT